VRSNLRWCIWTVPFTRRGKGCVIRNATSDQRLTGVVAIIYCRRSWNVIKNEDDEAEDDSSGFGVTPCRCRRVKRVVDGTWVRCVHYTRIVRRFAVTFGRAPDGCRKTITCHAVAGSRKWKTIRCITIINVLSVHYTRFCFCVWRQ